MGEGSINVEEMFPPLSPGHIYVALTGGVESTLILYLVQQYYPAHKIIPCTYRFGDRRHWEFDKARAVVTELNAGELIDAGFMKNSALMAAQLPSAEKYFNRENGVFNNVRKQDPLFVAGFTGKNTTTLDPEIITPEEQIKYLVTYNIHRPFLPLNKHQTLSLYYQLGVEHLLKYTHSCQRRGTKHCGHCHACWERVDAFDALGKIDPAIYQDPFEVVVQRVRKYFKETYPPRQGN